MSGELSPVPTGAEAPATQLTAELMREIRVMLGQSVERAEQAMEMIRAAAGPQPGAIPQDMIIKINQGAGYLRVCRDTIERMFREWRKIVLQQTCQHDGGLAHTSRHSYCKLCDLELFRGADGQYRPAGGEEKA